VQWLQVGNRITRRSSSSSIMVRVDRAHPKRDWTNVRLRVNPCVSMCVCARGCMRIKCVYMYMNSFIFLVAGERLTADGRWEAGQGMCIQIYISCEYIALILFSSLYPLPVPA